MNRKVKIVVTLVIALAGIASIAHSDQPIVANMDERSKDIINRLLAAEEAQEKQLQSIIVDGTLIEKRLKGNDEVKEEKRFDKKIYFQRRTDSTRYWNIHERFLNFFKDGEEQKENKLRDEVKDKLKKQEKGRGNDKSKPITDIFLPRFRDYYNYTYAGVIDTLIDGYTCYHIKIRALDIKDDKKSRLNADFYIDTVSARPVFVEFAPAKLAGGLMFKFKEMAMTLKFSKIADGIWFPQRFWMRGKAKAGIFFTVRFETTETYSNPQINAGIESDIFTQSMSYAHTEG